MFPRRRHHSFLAALCGGWLFIGAIVANGEEATTPQPSSAVTQAGAAAVRDFTDFLKLEAERAERAAKHDSDVIEHTLTIFIWIVSVVGTLLVAGAGLVYTLFATWNRATITAIYQNQVKEQLNLLYSENAKTLKNVTRLITDLSKQQDIITQLVTMTKGSFPYAYLKDIYNKKTGKDPNQEFLFQDQTAFKREMGFLIDNGYIENINLDRYKDQQNILGDLTISDAGKLLITFFESPTYSV